MEKFFWADRIADEIVREKGGRSEYVCASGVTPSGTIHMGHFREVMTTDLVVRALKDRGEKVRFIYSWDDFDRFRKVPSNVPREYEKYVGMPVSDVPSPDGDGSYAEFFERQFERSTEETGIVPEFIRQSVMYRRNEYSDLIKKALENVGEIKKILNKYRKEPLGEDWLPLEIYCARCGKDFTKITKTEDYEIEYECECGNKERTDFRKDGNVKLVWRVDWPARWRYEEVDFEPGGIDHSVAGGSFTTAREIVRIFGREAPLYQIYEWIRPKGGKEFSSSAGNVMTMDEALEVYEPEVLRFLFVRTRPNKGFPLPFDGDVIKNYDEYDELEKKYYENAADPKEKRIYEFSQVMLEKERPDRTNFRHLITLVQVGKTSDLSGASEKRAEKVRNWLEKHAPEDFRFRIQDGVNADLDEGQKESMKILKNYLSSENCTEEELHNRFYEICASAGIKNGEFFRAAYAVIIGREKGPRLASLILAVGREKIVKLLEQV